MPSVLQAASSDPEHLARRYDGDIGMYSKMRNRISGRGGLELTEMRTGAAPWTPVNGHATSKRAHMVVDVANSGAAEEGVAKGSRLASAVASGARGTLGDGVAACRTRGVPFFVVVRRCTRRPVGRVSTARARAPSTSLHKTSSQHLAKVSRQENDHPRRVPV